MNICKHNFDFHNFDLFLVDLTKCGSIDSNVTKNERNYETQIISAADLHGRH